MIAQKISFAQERKGAIAQAPVQTVLYTHNHYRSSIYLLAREYAQQRL